MVGPQASPGHGGGWPWDERSFLLVAPGDPSLFSLGLDGPGPARLVPSWELGVSCYD